VLFRVFNARYTARAHTLVVSNVRPEEVPEPRLRSRFLDIAVCQVVPNGGRIIGGVGRGRGGPETDATAVVHRFAGW